MTSKKIRHQFSFLYKKDELPTQAVDLIMGFGHFDPKIPRTCGELFTQGKGRHILFTGGVGAGTIGIEGAEGDYFYRELHKHFPQIHPATITVENRSTNTAENVQFSKKVLAVRKPPLIFGEHIRSAILVATAYRQLRVFLTCQKLLPAVRLYNAPPQTTLEEERELYQQRGISLEELLPQEMERIATYPEKGWINTIAIPQELL